ncbi:uncharacterized protein N7459_006364 [Penicillium hispanicum]|uniref:uncharacterized protein n=1 Tax=Penicillium hispanicum TaxID=1080232 RepID=UPI0025414D27|nr:uncharacterized protein N7459_006364 [Penicillium hispanicum]KAJ5577400.1 hypothetical protein N7459_006364 [Penicillium hispanicum]
MYSTRRVGEAGPSTGPLDPTKTNHGILSPNPTHPDPFLHERFDRADDVEDELHSSHSPRAGCVSRNQFHPDPMTAAMAGFPGEQEPWNCTEDVYGTPLSSEISNGEIDNFIHDASGDNPNETQKASDGGTSTGAISDQPPNTPSLEWMMYDIDNEFAWREDCLRGREIHHFNWMGEPVQQQSSTSPSESLAVMLADPKIPDVQENYRVLSILRRASAFVDPVVMNLDGMDEDALLLRGSKLQRATDGHVFKYYTPHGQWLSEETMSTGPIILDDGNLDTHLAPNLVVANGYTQGTVIRSRGEWLRVRDEKIRAESPTFPPRNLHWMPVPSSLRYSRTVSSTEEDMNGRSSGKRPVERQLIRKPVTPNPINQPQSTSRRQRPREIPLHGGKSEDLPRDPTTYFSFPEPDLSKAKYRRCMKRILKRAYKTLSFNLRRIKCGRTVH